MVDAEKLEVGANLLKKENVRSDFAFAAEVIEAPVFTKRHVAGGEGENAYSFDEVNLVWSVVQRYPEPRNGAQPRTIQFRLSEAQADAVAAGVAPRMTPRSQLGAVVEQNDRAGLPAPDSPDMQGHVVAVRSYDEEYGNKTPRRTRRRYDIIADLGTRKTYNADEAKTLIDELNEGERTAQQETASY